MITFSRLGNYGRLGNQMFQYAAIVGIAKKSGYDFCFPLKQTELLRWFNITTKDLLYNCKKVHVEQFSFNSKIFELPDELDYSGYLQTEKYFNHCSDLIKSEFSFRENIKSTVDDFIEKDNYISVHVRRKDYLDIQSIHPIPSLKWYNEAMEYFSDDNKFLFFSDDLEWCKKTFPDHRFSPFLTDGEDMYAMSKCKGHIISNSSFSWWSAWLGGKKTISPKIWFGPDGPQDWQDIYCPDWIIL